MLILGQLDAIEPHLQDAEKYIPHASTSEDATEVLGIIDGVRAVVALYQFDLPRASKLAYEAIGHLSTQNPFLRDMSIWLLGLAHYLNGDLALSKRVLDQSLELGERTDNSLAALLSVHILGYLQTIQGQLRSAIETYRRGLEFVKRAQARHRSLPTAGLVYAGMGEVLREQNELVAAERFFREGLELSRPWKSAEWRLDGYLGLARLKLEQGNLDEASSLILEIKSSLADHVLRWHSILLENLQAQVWLAAGNLTALAEWASAQMPPPFGTDQSQQVRILTLPMLARFLIAQRQFGRALELLTPFRQEAEAHGWLGIVIEASVLEALAFNAEGHTDAALTSLSRALALGEPEGYIRTFIDEGEQLACLLQQARARGIQPSYVSKLLATLEEESRTEDERRKAAPQPELVEPLSKRELEVLKLIAEGFSNQEITERLVVSLSTVKTHINRIFSKLGATSRKEAVARAKALKLL